MISLLIDDKPLNGRIISAPAIIKSIIMHYAYELRKGLGQSPFCFNYRFTAFFTCKTAKEQSVLLCI